MALSSRTSRFADLATISASMILGAWFTTAFGHWYEVVAVGAIGLVVGIVGAHRSASREVGDSNG